MWCSLWISCWFAALWWRMWGWTQRRQFRTGPALSVACLSHFRSLEKVLPRKPKLIQSCDSVVDVSSGRSAECSRPGCQQCCFLSECRLIPVLIWAFCVCGRWRMKCSSRLTPSSTVALAQNANCTGGPSPSWLQGVWCSWDDMKLVMLCHDDLVEHNLSQTGHQSF